MGMARTLSGKGPREVWELLWEGLDLAAGPGSLVPEAAPGLWRARRRGRKWPVRHKVNAWLQ